MKRYFILSILAVVTTILSLVSCKKDVDRQTAATQSSANLSQATKGTFSQALRGPLPIGPLDTIKTR